MRHKVKDAVKDVFEEHLVKDECCHYWILEMANGPPARVYANSVVQKENSLTHCQTSRC